MHEELMIWFAQAVAHSLWEGLAIGALAWLAVRLVRKSPAKQHAVLCGAMVLMALCLPVNLVVLTPGLKAASAGLAQGQRAPIVSEAVAAEGLLDLETVIAPSVGANLNVVEGSEASGASLATIDWQRAAPWVVAMYAAGFLAMLLRFGFACSGCRRLRKRTRVVTEGAWLDSYRRVRLRLELKFEPLLAWSDEVAAPVLVGVFKPMVLLPVALANRLSMEQAEAVLAHELAHLRRHDQWILAFQRVVETVVFYHPVTWWMSRAVSRAREQACDDLVLATGSRPEDYAEALVLCSELRLAAAGLPDGAAMQLAATGGKGRSLRQRVMRVLGQDDPIRPGRSGWLVAGIAALAVVVAGAYLLPIAEAHKPERGREPVPAEDSALTPLATPEDDLLLPPRSAGLDAENRPPLRVVDPGGPPILVELLLAEVLDDYAVNDKSMQEEVVSKHGKIVSEPRLIVASGRKGRVKTTRAGEVINPNAPQLIDYEVEVTPELKGRVVAYTMKVTRAQGAGQGTKLLLSAEISRRDPVSSWRAFEVGSMIGGAKLAGAVRFSQAKVGQKVDPPGVFFLLPNGMVRWEGKVYDLPGLRGALPHRGGEVAVKATGDMPYQLVVDLVEVLKPVYQVRLEVAEDVPGVPKREKPLGDEDRLARIAELETQIAECEVERARLRIDLTVAPKNHGARNRLEAVNAHLEDLQAAKAKLEGGELKRLPRDESGAKILELEAKLRALRAKGLGENHPRVRQIEEQLETLWGTIPDGVHIPNQVQLRWAKLELWRTEDALDELRARGFGKKHPNVRLKEERLKTVQDLIKRLEAQKTEQAPDDFRLPGTRPLPDATADETVPFPGQRPADPPPPNESKLPDTISPEEDAGADDGSRADEPANATGDNLAKPDAAEAWYNSLPERMSLPQVDPSSLPLEQFPDQSYPLYVPGAPYPKTEGKDTRKSERLPEKEDDKDKEKK